MRRTIGLFLMLSALTGCAADTDDDAGVGASAQTEGGRVAEVLYGRGAVPAGCAEPVGAAQARCLVAARYAQDPASQAVALDLLDRTGGVPGVLPAQRIDGGYRGSIELVPELPVLAHAKHLVFARDAMVDIDAFFAALGRAAPSPLRYRWRGIDFRFFRSVGRTTPSAFTEGTWEVAYNVSGSLVSTGPMVRETLFHEIFHVNDWTHDDWSRALAPVVDAVVARCGTRTACLAPYAPTKTLVRGGTYYAFQPDNGSMVVEYAAELATRYFEEQRAALASTRLPDPPFKCGPPENRRAWDLLRGEFFGGADLTPACGP